jgi:hypothetical protein
MNINEHTGKEMSTGYASTAYSEGWERIFGKKVESMCRQQDVCKFPDCGCPLEEQCEKNSHHS